MLFRSYQKLLLLDPPDPAEVHFHLAQLCRAEAPDQAKRHEPRVGETFDFEDTRKDAECTDTVGIFLRVDVEQRVRFRVTLGPQVQTLTRAMAVILCTGLEGATVEEVLALPADFVPRIVGAQLVRIRSQTVYYVLMRMKEACARA